MPQPQVVETWLTMWIDGPSALPRIRCAIRAAALAIGAVRIDGGACLFPKADKNVPDLCEER